MLIVDLRNSARMASESSIAALRYITPIRSHYCLMNLLTYLCLYSNLLTYLCLYSCVFPLQEAKINESKYEKVF